MIAPTAQPLADPSLLLTKAELARHLGITERTADALEKAGKLPKSIRVGDRKRWSRDVIVAWIESQQDSTL